MKLFIKYIFILLAAIIIILPSCSDDLPMSDRNEIIEGHSAVISISTNVGSMPEMTRANMTEGTDKEIKSIWLGFFRKSDKRLAYKFEYGNQTDIPAMDMNFNTLENIEINSGEYYIAAVANPKGNYGVLYGSDGQGVTSRTELINLLNRQNLTFDDYLNIAFMRGDGITGAINTPTGNLPMQGVYISSSNESHPISSDRVAELTNQAVYIAPTGTTVKKLDGAIHFRRLVSQNVFNISYDTSKIKDFEIVEARVYNVPVVSWIAERKDKQIDTNAGDIGGIIGNTSSSETLEAPAQPNYLASTRLQNTELRRTTNGYQFDWWQLENRRYASSEITDYSMREHERPISDSDKRNTGIYTALSGATGYISNNNCATYVRFHVRMEMIAGQTSDAMDANSKLTSVDAYYVVHLGYCEGTDSSAKLMDFNCRRNTKYIYNVKIFGVEKIVVEARQLQESYENGVEGTVTFVTDQYFESDAHFTAYNIKMTNKERAQATWKIRVYTSANKYSDISNENCSSYDEKYYNWIELRPTSGENVLAPYKPYSGTGSVANATANNPRTMRVTDLRNLQDFPSYNMDTSSTSETDQWYTVFVNEYIYEDDYNSNTSANWEKYVNLPERTFWLQLEEYESADGESSIINSKYAIRQKSIQTFYRNTGAGVAFGTEHENEMFRYPDVGLRQYSTEHKMDGDDSRLANYNYFSDRFSSLNWNDFIANYSGSTNTNLFSGATPLKVNNVNTGLADIKDIGTYSPYFDTEGTKTYTSSRYAEEICLNRNRDLNGNGLIDMNEVRWILPNMYEYKRMVLGGAGLQTGLVDFEEFENEKLSEKDYFEKSKYHFASIDHNQLWGEEYLSDGWNANTQCPAPQQARCIRYLGNDMSSTTKIEEAPTAKVTGDIMEFYYIAELYRDFASDALSTHRVIEMSIDLQNFNRPYKKMQFKTSGDDEISLSAIQASETINTNVKWFKYLEDGNNPCDKYNTNGMTGWRVPNQAEIAALGNAGLLFESNYATCTKEYVTNNPRSMGWSVVQAIALDDGRLAGAKIRCVRDVEN